MKQAALICMAAAALGLLNPALALDKSSPILCASTDVYECVDGRDCRTVLAEAVGAPTFFRIDLVKAQIKVSVQSDPLKAANFSELEDRWVLQGVNAEPSHNLGGTAWTISVEDATARMVATAVMDQAAVVIFGACTEI